MDKITPPRTGAQRVARHKQRQAERNAARDAALQRIANDPAVRTVREARAVAQAALEGAQSNPETKY